VRTTSAHRARANLMLIGIIVAFAVLAGRIYYLQHTVHASYVREATRKNVIRVRVPAERGAILARDGTKLAVSLPAGQVCADLRHLGDRRETARNLAPLIGSSEAEVYRRITSERIWVVLARGVELEKSRAVRELGLKGVHVLCDSRRFYPHGRTFCHVVGLFGGDGRGLEGAERSFEQKLAGTDGVRVLARDARQKLIVMEDGFQEPPRPGTSVMLTIDPVVQAVAVEQLKAAVEKHRPKGAWVVAMEPHTGRIRAMVSWPDYDPNDRSRLDRDSMRNRTITDVFEPGSTFKPVTWAKSLEHGTARLGERIFCENGAWQIGSRIIHSAHPYGTLTFEMGLVKSDNVMAAKLGKRLGIERLYAAVRAFGYGERSGVELPGEIPGLVRPRAVWSEYSVTSVPMGQEIAVTPLQLVAGHAAVANGGILVRPTIIERYLDAKGKMVGEPSNPHRGRCVPEEIALTVRDLMRRVVEEGTGRRAKIDEYALCGKTGTAQKVVNGAYSDEKYVGSFVGFGPADDPRLVVLVSLDEPRGSYYGGTVAAPAAGEILKRSLKHLGVPARNGTPGRGMLARAQH